MPRFLLTHRHAATECPVAFAAWRGFESPLRHGTAIANCAWARGDGGHLIWWTVEAADADAALALLPPYLADRAEVSAVGEVGIP